MRSSLDPVQERVERITRRQILGRGARGLGAAALALLLDPGRLRAAGMPADGAGGPADSALRAATHFAPRAKRAIYLHMVGAPSQLETFDYKPGLSDLFDKELPPAVRGGQRLTGMTSGQTRFPVAPSIYKFSRHGQSGTWVSDVLPFTARMADDICVVRTMHTEAINHEPAIVFIQTGSQVAGKPCIGSWLSYGLGSMNDSLPTFVVMTARHTSPSANVQAISSRLWSSGFLPSDHAGVALRSVGDPVLYLKNPAGVDQDARRLMLNGVNRLNELTSRELGDPETHARVQQFEMAFRMQRSVPELTDLASEPAAVRASYGPQVDQPGSFAHCALMARRLVERGVRCVQVYHRGWDSHGNLPGHFADQCRDVDQPCWALIQDLKQRGLFDDTLVIWGGEFGRTVYCQGKLTREDYGRDHHPRCFSLWLAGGGIRGGTTYGETDDFSYNIVQDPVHVRDFTATLLHQFGFDHERFTYKFQGLDQRLTGVEPARVVREILA
ncbi:MAG TPA: DUF1501 domain-containing protein [Planctomycetota bacterium]|nr:DUF1501 domain-containing protein [Planctomycetota bacterium]